MSAESMCKNKSEGIQYQLMLEQYKRCAEDIRHLDRLLWEIPFSTMFTVSGLLSLAYGFLKDVNVVRIVLVILIVYAFIMMFETIKIRFFQVARAIFAEEIEKTFSVKSIPVESMQALEFLSSVKQQKIPRMNKFIYKRRAGRMPIFLFLAIITALIHLLIATFIR
jgi:hypothetical protein